MLAQKVKEVDYYDIIQNFDSKTKEDLGISEIEISSKTNGVKILKLRYSDYIMLKHFWGGFCIQSTNTKGKGKGKNPSLYPVVWRYEKGKTIVKKVHSALGIEIPKGYVVDHLNGNTFDNRPCNLEVVTRAENTRRAQVKRRR
jgi:hypothetical protein